MNAIDIGFALYVALISNRGSASALQHREDPKKWRELWIAKNVPGLWLNHTSGRGVLQTMWKTIPRHMNCVCGLLGFSVFSQWVCHAFDR